MRSMPSLLHDLLVQTIRDRPGFAAELLAHMLNIQIPEACRATVHSPDLTDAKSVSLFADVVVLLTQPGADKPFLAVIIEVQLRTDSKKRQSWPAYVAVAYRNLGCEVALLVIAPLQKLAAWCAQPIEMGPPASAVTPIVVGPDAIPAIADPETARQSPELCALSAIAHADTPQQDAVFNAFVHLIYQTTDEDALKTYTGLVFSALSESAREQLETIMEKLVDIYPHARRRDFIGRALTQGFIDGQAKGEKVGRAKGKAEGLARGRIEGFAKGRIEGLAKAILSILDARGVAVNDDARARITGCSDIETLTGWTSRAATAAQVHDLFDASSDTHHSETASR